MVDVLDNTGPKVEAKQKIRAAKVMFSEDVKKKFLEDARSILDSGWMVLGEYTKRFEEVWASRCNRKFGIAVSCDTAALEISLKLIVKYWEKKGDKRRLEVILPATSFFSCVTSVRNAGLIPKIVDISIENGIHSTKEQIEEAMSDRTAALMLVYAGGYVPVDIKEIIALCEEKGVPTVEDAAHCHLTELNGEVAGQWGDFSCFSFFCTKTLGFGEGGMILTDNDRTAKDCKTMRNYGRDAEFGSSTAIMEGYNWRLPEIECALGLRTVEDADRKVAERRKVAAYYDEMLSKIYPVSNLGVSPLSAPDGMKLNYYRYLVMVRTEKRRQKVIKDLAEIFDVHCPGSVYDMPCTDQKIFPELKSIPVPIARDYCNRHLCLPMYEKMENKEVVYVFESLVKVLSSMKFK